MEVNFLCFFILFGSVLPLAWSIAHSVDYMCEDVKLNFADVADFCVFYVSFFFSLARG